MPKSLVRLFLVAASLLPSLCTVHANTIYAPYSFRTLAGLAPGNIDGNAANARFTMISGMTSDSAGNIYLVDQVANTVRKIAPSGVVTTVAGFAGYSGSSDGFGSAARFKNPRDIAIDPSGNLYVADTGNSTIRKITPDGNVSTIAGFADHPGYQDGTGIIARFQIPSGIVWVGGTLFISDTSNSLVRAMDANGAVTTFAGKQDTPGTADGAGGNARLYAPGSIRADASGNLFVAEPIVHTVREITPAGVVTTIAGKPQTAGNTDGVGSGALFNQPTYLAVDAAGNVYVSDINNGSIRKIAPEHTVSTFIPPGPFAAVRGITLANGQLYIGDPVNGAIFVADPSGNVSVFAGTPSAGEVDGAGAQARFWQPAAVGCDSNNNVYIADAKGGAIRKVTPAGQVTTIAAGSGQFSNPQGIAVDATGNVYVANSNASTINKITPDGTVTIFAGSVAGSADGNGTAAQFRGPTGLAIDGAGNLYVADTGNYTIRKITPAGAVSKFAGAAGVAGAVDGSNAEFAAPQGVAVDSSGNVFVADTYNHLIRKITPGGTTSTIAGKAGAIGGDDKVGTNATFTLPFGIAVDSSGNVFVSEQYTETIRRIAPDGTVRTIAGGSGVPGSSDGAGASALFYGPTGLATDSSGRLYVADGNNNVVRVSSAGPVSQVLNISTRGLVGTNNDVLIGGVISVGSSSKSVLLRAIGPSLASAGVQGALGDPVLELHDSSGALVASNDNWKSDAASGQSQENAIRATGVPPLNDAESALLATLAPSQNYTVVVRGNNNGTGVALVEVYDLDSPSGTSRLANISTRGVVQATPNQLIGGVIVGGQPGTSNVLVRAIGPSLVAAGVANALPDPTLELHDANGTLVGYDDNWRDSNAAAIQQTGIAPSDDRESVILALLTPGNYTAVVSGKGSETGVALVEAYNVPN
ncbi:MAG: NHL repeat-containing protein [Chthoniobacterales bacterium]